MKALRLLPVLIMTSVVLLGLKSFEWVTGGAQRLSGIEVAVAQDAASEDASMEGEAAMTSDDMTSGDMTSGDMASGEMAVEGEDAMMDDASMATQEPLESVDEVDFVRESSRDLLLERLGERRVVLEEREQDLRVREQLLEAAERRLEERMAELAALEERVSAASEAEEQRESEEIGRLVQVYSAMRAKDAAAIFDLLDLPILMEVANAMNPRKMADILGEMTPESARRLTIALAGRPPQPVVEATNSIQQLPQIEGVPIQ